MYTTIAERSRSFYESVPESHEEIAVPVAEDTTNCPRGVHKHKQVWFLSVSFMVRCAFGPLQPGNQGWKEIIITILRISSR